MELEVEGAADALPQGHAPGPVDGRAEGSVDHQLHTAALVEKPFGDHPVGGGHHAENPLSFNKVSHQLAGDLDRHAGFGHQPRFSFLRLVQEPVDAFPKLRNLVREFPGAAGGFPQPEGVGWQIALGVFDTNPPAFHAADFPGGVAQ